MLIRHLGSLTFALVLLGLGPLVAQQKVALAGKLLDTLSREPLSYATISLQGAGRDSLVQGQVADEQGTFTFTGLAQELFVIKIEHVGYRTKYLLLDLANTSEKLELGDIQLAPLEQLLETVTIRGQKKSILATLEKRIFRSEQFAVATGGTATDVLRNLPGVSINAEGEILLRGAKGFLILINGKPSQIEAATLLNQIPANTIDKIELITAPSARYDADGKAGIINIVTKTGTTDGVALLSNIQGGFPRLQAYPNLNEPQRYGLDATLSWRKKRWEATLAGNYLRNDIAGQRVGDVNTTRNGVTTFFPSSGERSYRRSNYGLRALLAYQPNANNEFTAGFYQGARSQLRRADILYNNRKVEAATNALRSSTTYFNRNLVEKKGTFTVGNLDYTHRFGRKSSVQISGLLESATIRGVTENANLNPTNFLDTIQFTRNDGATPLLAWRLQVDFEQKIANGQLTLGYQLRRQDQTGSFSYREQNGNGTPLLINPAFTADIAVENRIQAGYGQYAGSHQKLSYVVGLRYEAAWRKFADNQGNKPEILELSNFFPSLNLGFDLGPAGRAKLAYSRRVQRATNNELNPYPEREHSETLEQGDPTILPEFIGVYEAGWSKDFEQGSWYWNVYTQQISNIINRVNQVYNDSILSRIFTNAGRAQLWGTEAGLSLSPRKNLQLFVGGNLYNLTIRGSLFGNQVEVDSRGWVYTLNSNINWQMGPQRSLQFNLAYLSSRNTAQGEDSRFYQPSLAFKQSLFRNRLKATLQWQNLGWGNMGVNEQRITTRGSDFFTTTNYIQETNIFLLNLTYQFNQSDRKTKLPRSEFGEREY